MKKIVFMLAAMVLCAFSLSAQKEVKLRFGVLGGFNMTKWNGELLPDYSESIEDVLAASSFTDLEDAGFTPGFHVGALADMVINDKWSIQPELLFAFEGSKVFDDQFRALFIKIPVIVYYNILNVGPGQLSPGIGPYFAGAVGGSSKEYGDTFGKDGVLDEFDWGLNVKVNYEFQKFASGLFAGAYFAQGFTTSKTTGFGISVGYKFQYWKYLKKVYNTGVLEYNP
ncbi:MAG: PorT family protein [Paludibacteraceae bacterium]|nr:PorT family protein [Paludibacteraceae bacterium]